MVIVEQDKRRALMAFCEAFDGSIRVHVSVMDANLGRCAGGEDEGAGEHECRREKTEHGS